MSDIKLYNGDCLEIMKQIQDKSIDMILCDLPYGTTACKWDSIIPFDKLWENYKRIIKDDGIVILTAVQPFTSKLVISNLSWFKYDLIWEKTLSSGQLNIKTQPLRSHEDILIFYKKFHIYNEQKTEGTPYIINRKYKYDKTIYNNQTDSFKVNEGYRHAKSIIRISNPRIQGGHPTQKPLELMEYLIKTYSNENQTVLDNCMGSGTTGVACKLLNRNFIGIELNENYFKMAKERIENTYVPKRLF